MAPKPPKQNLWQALSYASDLGFTIAVPLVVFALGGRLLDRHFGTSPWLLVAGILVSILVSSILLVRKATALLRAVEQSAADDTTHRENDGASSS